MIHHDVHAYLDEEGNVVHIVVSDGDLGAAPMVDLSTADGEPVPLTLERLSLTSERLLDSAELFPHLERERGPAGGLRWKPTAPGELRGIELSRRPTPARNR